jgi:hypothetical protein
VFRSALQRLAHRLHVAGESTRAPLSEAGMEFAVYVNLGVAAAGLVLFYGPVVRDALSALTLNDTGKR